MAVTVKCSYEWSKTDCGRADRCPVGCCKDSRFEIRPDYIRRQLEIGTVSTAEGDVIFRKEGKLLLCTDEVGLGFGSLTRKRCGRGYGRLLFFKEDTALSDIFALFVIERLGFAVLYKGNGTVCSKRYFKAVYSL